MLSCSATYSRQHALSARNLGGSAQAFRQRQMSTFATRRELCRRGISLLLLTPSLCSGQEHGVSLHQPQTRRPVSSYSNTSSLSMEHPALHRLGGIMSTSPVSCKMRRLRLGFLAPLRRLQVLQLCPTQVTLLHGDLRRFGCTAKLFDSCAMHFKILLNVYRIRP